MSKKIKLGNSEIQLDAANPIKHGQRNRTLVLQSLQENGAGRSILLDESNEAIVGNLTAETAAELGFKLKIIDIAADELLAARRSDLTPEQKRAMKIADNLAGSARDRKWNNLVLDDYDEAMLTHWMDGPEIRAIYPDGLESYKEPEFQPPAAKESNFSINASLPAQSDPQPQPTDPNTPPVPELHPDNTQSSSILAAPKSIDRHPLSIVLSNSELRAWTQMKKELGVRGDKEALLQLINYHKVS